MSKHAFIPLSFFSVLFLASCGEHNLDDILACSSIECVLDETNIISRTGWLAAEENLSNIPQDIQVSTGSANNPPNFSLEDKFPPIGDQGQYGTCVAWATGYNLKTSLNAIDKGWSSADLSKTANQTSPKDLWFAISNADKGANCGGTYFEPALDALISKGAATLSTVPYNNLGNCSGSSVGNANNKLANYRKIAYNNVLAGGTGSGGMTLDNFRTYLAQGRPILIGARLGDRFMSWNSASTISSDTYNNPGMQHAYHAMILVGYDDSREAFRVRNSWGQAWGNNGSVWVDYDFFLNRFCYAAFVAQNPPAEVKDSEIANDDLLEGYDLLAAYADDWGANRNRTFTYDVYNSGKNTISASQKWRVLYMYYNASNANEYGIIFEDYYTNEYGSLGDDGVYTESSALIGGWWNNVNVAPGKKAGEAEYGEYGFQISYVMPTITGKYYLVIYADAYDAIKESNEDNNFYFITAAGGKPLDFANGILQSRISTAKVLAKASGESTPQILPINAYTPAEIRSLVLQSKKSGALAKKVADYREANSQQAKKTRR
jgi:hypothetical protein